MKLLDCRLLLGKAVKSAKTPDQFATINRDEPAIGEEWAENFQRALIVRIGKGRYKHTAVGDVEIGIACRQREILAHDFFRHRQLVNFKFFAANSHRAQAREISLQWFVIRIITIAFHHSDDRGARNKARQIINVTISIVSFDAVAQPENVAHAEESAQTFLDILARQFRVAIWMEQTRFRSE